MRLLLFGQEWQQNSNGQSPPEFMSTHPSDATRINLKAMIPEAKATQQNLSSI
jgi:Zn-dependent protease with chaperone function